MKPMLSLMQKDPYFDLVLLVTDQHLSSAHGSTWNEIERDGFNYTALPMNQDSDTAHDRTVAEGNGMHEIARSLLIHNPDILVLFGDRGESLAAAHAALNFNIPIAHIQGGDISGGVDNKIRNAITCMSDMHFVSCSDSAERANKFIPHTSWTTIFQVGDFHIDALKDGTYSSSKEIRNYLGLGEQPIILVTQHSDTLSPSTSYNEMFATLNAIKQEYPLFEVVVTYPCSDVGYEGILGAMGYWQDEIRVFKALSPDIYRSAIKEALLLVGNSSAGIIEAPYLCTPSVDIGYRQAGRGRSSCIFHASHNEESIKDAMQDAIAWSKGSRITELIYGAGTAGLQTIEELREWWSDQKQHTS